MRIRRCRHSTRPGCWRGRRCGAPYKTTQWPPNSLLGARHSSGASSHVHSDRASCALMIMSEPEARGPEDHERHWSGALPAKILLQPVRDGVVDLLEPDEFQRLAHFLGDVVVVASVARRQHHAGDAGAGGGHDLLL